MILAPLASLALAAAGATVTDDPPPARLADPTTGATVSVADVADALCRRDVVFFGELHDNGPAHETELALARELFARRPDLVLSFEMFERDCQGVVDDYLADRIDEATFRARSRPWPNYADAYRPLIEFAKEHHLPVVAGCIPWKTAVQFGKSGQEPKGSPWIARNWVAPKDDYRARFVETMKDHVKDDGSDGTMERMYRSQCLRDDTMAESISDTLARFAHRRALVLHYCGSFHSDFGYGTVARVVQRTPSVSLGIVTTMQADHPEKFDVKPERRRAHFILVAPPAPEKPEPEKKPESAAVPAPEPKAATGDAAKGEGKQR